MTIRQIADFAATTWGALSKEEQGIIVSSIVVWAIKPKSAEDFAKKASFLRSPRAVKLINAFARLAPDWYAFFRDVTDAIFGEIHTPNVYRALKSLPPPPNETPPILIEGEEPKK